MELWLRLCDMRKMADSYFAITSLPPDKNELGDVNLDSDFSHE